MSPEKVPEHICNELSGKVFSPSMSISTGNNDDTSSNSEEIQFEMDKEEDTEELSEQTKKDDEISDTEQDEIDISITGGTTLSGATTREESKDEDDSKITLREPNKEIVIRPFIKEKSFFQKVISWFKNLF